MWFNTRCALGLCENTSVGSFHRSWSGTQVLVPSLLFLWPSFAQVSAAANERPPRTATMLTPTFVSLHEDFEIRTPARVNPKRASDSLGNECDANSIAGLQRVACRALRSWRSVTLRHHPSRSPRGDVSRRYVSRSARRENTGRVRRARRRDGALPRLGD